MADQNYEIGLRITATSDDGALTQTEQKIQQLTDRLDPLSRATRKLEEDQALLARAYNNGNLTIDQYKEAWHRLSEEFKQTSDKIRGAGEAAEGTSSMMGGMAAKLLEIVAAVETVRRAFEFLKDAFRESVEHEHVFNNLANAATTFANATTEETDKLREWVETIEIASGKSASELIPAFNSLLLILHDTGQAQEVLQIAAGAAARGIGSVGENATTMGRALAGLPIRATSDMGRLLQQAKNRGEDLADYINNKLIPAYGDAGASVSDMKTNMDRAMESWGQAKAMLGESFSPMLTSILVPAVKGAATVMMWFGSGLKMTVLEAEYAARGMQMLSNAMNSLVKGDASGMKALWQNLKDLDASRYIEQDKIIKETESFVSRMGEAQNALVKERVKETGKTKLNDDPLVEAYKLRMKYAELAANTEQQKAASLLAIYKKMAADMNLTDEHRLDAQLKVHQIEVAAATKAAEEGKRAKEKADREAQQNHDKILRTEIENDKAAGKQKEFFEKLYVANRLKQEKTIMTGIEKFNKEVEKDTKKTFDKIVKDEQAADKRRVAVAKLTTSTLVGLASQYGGKTGQAISQIVTTAEKVYQLWAEISNTFFATQQATTLAGAITEWTTSKAKDSATAEMQTQVWATNAASAVASIPYVGPVLAAAAYAAAQAAGQASVAAIAAVPPPAAAKGAFLQSATTIAAGEAGPELVLPPRFTRMFDAMSKGFSGNGPNYNNTYTNYSHPTTIVNMQAFGPAEADAHMRAFERRRRVASIGLDRTLAQRNIVKGGSKRGPRWQGRP